ncbi:MAG: class I SAM-dependent methyltransferase [Anaerolineae bacterium]|nr:class I SAM-dependent methyltransferase [Anaerolineae bacterium]
MKRKTDESSAIEANIRHCYSTWGESYYRDYYESATAYPPVHTAIVRKRLEADKVRTLLDAGCGPASMLRDLDGLGIDRYGFDLTPEMVAEAKRVMESQGVAGGHIWQGSVLERASFSPPTGAPAFDAAICFGVLPHVPSTADGQVLFNLASSVREGGLVMVEARNQLFALFTLNRYSHDFFLESLVDLPALKRMASPEEAVRLDEAASFIGRQFRMDLPPVRQGKGSEPGYDEVLSRTHNPFELRLAAERAGLRDVSVLFYHYHCMPPMVESILPDFFRRASLAMEDPADWRGHFMASAFILAGYRAER